MLTSNLATTKQENKVQDEMDKHTLKSKVVLPGNLLEIRLKGWALWCNSLAATWGVGISHWSA